MVSQVRIGMPSGRELRRRYAQKNSRCWSQRGDESAGSDRGYRRFDVRNTQSDNEGITVMIRLLRINCQSFWEIPNESPRATGEPSSRRPTLTRRILRSG
jgi:hypothetical protein